MVYHSRYLDFFERARADWLRHLGYESSRLVQDYGVVLVVRKVALNYHQPARLDDEVEVFVDEIEVKRAQITLRQTVRRNGLMLADANVNLASVSVNSFLPVKLPESLMETLKHYV